MEKLLIFHLEHSELTKLKKIAGAMKIRLEIIDPANYLQPLENLANGRPSPLVAPFTGELPEESLILFCDFTEKRMDKLLAALRQNNVSISLKAVLTPTNRKWNFMRLLLEMYKEQQSFSKMTPG